MARAKSGAAAPDLEVRDLAPELWPALEQLFGKNGACGGCWCQAWRIAGQADRRRLQGEPSRKLLRQQVLAGETHGVLAFDRATGTPVGWCAYDRRTDFARLANARSLACDDAERVWSLTCFYVAKGWRGKGVAGALLEFALAALKARGAEIAEGYPVKPAANGEPLPAAFAWTGTRSLFAAAGFKVVGNPDGGKQRVRKRL